MADAVAPRGHQRHDLLQVPLPQLLLDHHKRVRGLERMAERLQRDTVVFDPRQHAEHVIHTHGVFPRRQHFRHIGLNMPVGTLPEERDHVEALRKRGHEVPDHRSLRIDQSLRLGDDSVNLRPVFLLAGDDGHRCVGHLLKPRNRSLDRAPEHSIDPSALLKLAHPLQAEHGGVESILPPRADREHSAALKVRQEHPLVRVKGLGGTQQRSLV
mmetsp:Transcript_98058/g.280571  ORF Transcript_98058/g.280571 Transcript_98058/m.280571 type:complete len:213 (-) Transcript_98058:1191-1829(-)